MYLLHIAIRMIMLYPSILIVWEVISMRKNLKWFIFGFIVFAFGYGFLDIPIQANGVVIEKEKLHNAEAGYFTIEVDKWFPKKVYDDGMEYTAFDIGDEVIIKYKISLLRKPYVLEYVKK